ncbi:MAG: ATP-binding protein [Terriglobia bacterium]
MAEQERPTFAWMDLLWLAFLLGLALLQPLFEIHKQLTLLALGLLQILEQRFISILKARGPTYSVILKIVLASSVVNCTGGIESSYYLIYFLPVVTAAMYFEAWESLLWTALTSAAYCSFLLWVPWWKVEVDAEGATELLIRNLFLFLAAIVVNRFVTENRRQSRQYRQLAETLAETNRRLEQIQAEARRSERLAALGQLSAGLAHEIRNPLGVIKGSSEMLNKRLQGSDQVAGELAGYISSEVNRLNMIVTRFLDFARPSNLQFKTEAVTPVVDRALKNAHDRWPEARVEVQRDYAREVPPVPLDADMCEQVFTNLFLNAYEAMEKDGGTLKVTIARANHDGRQGVEIEIHDSGPGIPAELREQIFNPFFTTKKSGVGLGLSIVSKIIDDHRGWIRLSSDTGKGASFRVFLPAEAETGN